jgi:uncharacterized damage-inducible protein DinB
MTTSGKTGTAVAQLLVLLDTAYDAKSWHGTNLRGALRGVPLDQASWRPRPGAHNIWELLVHAAYWKYAAWRRLTGSKRGSFPLKGSNFFVRPEARTARAWRQDLRVLESAHRQLRGAVDALSPGDLDVRVGGTLTRLTLVTGVAAHDLYHAGQIQLLKKLKRLHESGRRAGRRSRST